MLSSIYGRSKKYVLFLFVQLIFKYGYIYHIHIHVHMLLKLMKESFKDIIKFIVTGSIQKAVAQDPGSL